MESWRTCWREGFAPCISTRGLEALRLALQNDDKRLIQGRTCVPCPVYNTSDCPVKACCPVSFTGWHGNDLKTTLEVNDYFRDACANADKLLNEPASCRYFTNWWDETDRETARLALLEEVTLELSRRMTNV